MVDIVIYLCVLLLFLFAASALDPDLRNIWKEFKGGDNE